MDIPAVSERRPVVAVLVLPDSTASVVFGMYDLLRSAGRDWGMVVDGMPGTERLIAVTVAETLDPVYVSNGVMVVPTHTYDTMPAPDVVVVPELNIPPGMPFEVAYAVVLERLRVWHAQGCIIASACSGSLLMAAAGLLDGHDATSHWAYCDHLRRHYPEVRVHRDRSLVVTGDGHRLIMAGGGTTWLDLALYLTARLVSLECAMQVARLNLIDWHAQGQAPFAMLTTTRQTSDAAVAAAQRWMAENLRDQAPVDGMIRASGLPARTFARRFKSATGMTAIAYVHAVRLERAKELLERTDEPVDGVAFDVGYEDAGFFSRLFRRHVGFTPAAYRRRYASLLTST
jgi:transcriptional regulator GlxA family with amidase domain